jgi:two-component system response regulator PhoP
VRILIIKDEKRLAGNIARSLRDAAGSAFACAYDGAEGLFMAESNAYDLVIHDLMLPQADGLSVLSRKRDAKNASPVLVLTALDERESVVQLLNARADNYVTELFDLGELIVRANALIRRGKGHSAGILKVRDVEIDVSGRSRMGDVE